MVAVIVVGQCTRKSKIEKFTESDKLAIEALEDEENIVLCSRSERRS
jgi:hypothetical protein